MKPGDFVPLGTEQARTSANSAGEVSAVVPAEGASSSLDHGPRTTPPSSLNAARFRRPPRQQQSPLGPDEELAWLRRCVDADSARLSILRAEYGRLVRDHDSLVALARDVVNSFDRKPTEGCVRAVKALGERVYDPAADADIPNVHDDPSWGPDSAARFGKSHA